jgi:hypothetical protein
MKQALPLQTGATPGGTVPKPARRGLLPLGLGIIVALLGINLLLHHENRYEKLATDVTKAIAANDMRPVEPEFNALRRPQLEDRGKVGQLSDFVNADGTLKRIKEDTPAGAKAGYHHFTAEFDKGNLSEDLTVDADGKIADFHVRPLETK